MTEGEWPAVPGALKVFSGRLLARWTNGRLRPARHRMVAGGPATPRSTVILDFPALGRVFTPLRPFAGPGTGIHRMTHPAGPVTVHVYSPPLRAIGYYEIVDGLLQRVPGPPDDPSPESPRLLAALGGEARPDRATGLEPVR
jgi:hypothetical protein